MSQVGSLSSAVSKVINRVGEHVSNGMSSWLNVPPPILCNRMRMKTGVDP
jgi:hypothetical protein